MITVGKLAEKFGLSRTALLYYERIRLLRSTMRSQSGYRLYGDDAVARLRLISTYKNAGLPLGEIRKLLDARDAPNLGIFRRRIVELDGEIANLRVQQRALLGLLRSLGDRAASESIDKDTWVKVLRSAGMDEDAMDRWHAEFERNAPEGHHSFLRWLGLSEKEALAIRAAASGPPVRSRRRRAEKRPARRRHGG
jgi:MerR family transcriptional regulator, thiopeptide resistance regulator